MHRKNLDSMPCPIARSLERVGEWWSILILRDALAGLRRFDEFQKSLGIAPNMLTRRLNALVEAGLLERRRYSERPPRDEYVLTARGRDFRPVLIALLAWGNRHFAPEGASVQLVDTRRPGRRPTRSWSTAPPDDRSRRPNMRSRPARRRPSARAEIRIDRAADARARHARPAKSRRAARKRAMHERRALDGSLPRCRRRSRRARPRHEPAHPALLQGPIVPTLLRLAWPNVLVMLAQASTGLIETWFVSKLGTDALAGMALVFPGFMMMQMISAGAMGGGISSAIARALGAGRRDDADALVLHALIINIALGVTCSAIMLAFGRPIYRALGGEGASLEAALAYSNVVFAGNVLLWLMNGFASVIRGTGNMLVPALVICVGVVVLVPLSPLLIFGLGPFPALGIAGGGAALLVFYAAGTAMLAWYILSGRNIARLRPSRAALAVVPRHPARRRRRGRHLGADQRHHRADDRAGRRRRRRRSRRRLRHGRAAGIPADPARVRARRAAGRDGRHQHRRRPARARASHRHGRSVGARCRRFSRMAQHLLDLARLAAHRARHPVQRAQLVDDRALDARDRVGLELDLAVRVEALQRADEAEQAVADEVGLLDVRRQAVAHAAGDVLDERRVREDEAVARRLVALVLVPSPELR